MRAVICLFLIGCTASAADFSFKERTLTVPEGFEVELAAGPPLIERPMHAAFDEIGRLYVAESSGSNDKVEKQLADMPHRIVRLEDQDGDGRFDHSVIFADKMMLPHGALWHEGSLYVAAPPSIWKLTDTDGDGVADRREEWFKGGTLTGCANDLHGPFLGPDGWIYWCKGAFAKQTHEVAGQPFTSRASHVWRARPDGSRAEPVMTGGMDNPVELAFTPEGERIITCTFFQNPAAGQRDGLIHATYGGVYGKQHDVLDGHPRTGPDLMPVLTHLGPAAPAGLMRYRSKAFGAQFTNNLFAALFNLHKISRHTLESDGATFKTRDEDFVSSTDSDFHPTDVLEDADGSLLVVDTGGWYKLCCPTSQLYKPDVLGAIYRVRRKDSARPVDPRGIGWSWQNAKPDELVTLLGDSAAAMQDRAQAELRQHGETAIPALVAALDPSRSIDVRRNVVWTLAGIDAPAARAGVRIALGDVDDSIRHSAAQCAGLWRDAEAANGLIALLVVDRPQLQRAAAEALGRIRTADAIPSLLTALERADRVLAHSITYALIEIAEPARTTPGLQSDVPAIREAALFALEQMKGAIKPQLTDIRPWLLSGSSREREVALWVMARHPEWAGEIARELLAASADAKGFEESAALLARCTIDASVQSSLAAALGNEASAPRRKLILRAMALAPLKELPAAWATALPRLLGGSEAALAIAALGALPSSKANAPEVASALLPVVSDTTRPSELRLRALAAMPLAGSTFDTPAFDFALAQLSPESPPDARRTAVRVLAQAQLTATQLVPLADALQTAGPTDLPLLLAAFTRSSDASLGRRVLDAIRTSPGRAALDAATLKKFFTAFPADLQQEAATLLTPSLPESQRNHLDALVAAQQGGDIRRGQAVFNSAKAACSTCHAIGYLGGSFGPDLTRIGQVRNERDLLEGIVFPSASFVRSYEPLLVTSKSGEIHSGIIRGDNATEVLLATGPATEIRIPRGEISSMQPGATSLMPQGFDQILTPQELADLVAFLRASK